MVPPLCLKPDFHQSKERTLPYLPISTITAKLQTAKMHLISLSCATADKLISNYINNRLHYLFHLQMHLLKYWWVCFIQNNKVFQVEWTPGARKPTRWQSYWVASWSYSIELSTRILEYITEKILLESYLKGKKRSCVVYLVTVHQSFPISHQRPNGYQLGLFLIILILKPLNLWVRSLCGF